MELFEVCDLDMGAELLFDPIDRVHPGCQLVAIGISRLRKRRTKKMV